MNREKHREIIVPVDLQTKIRRYTSAFLILFLFFFVSERLLMYPNVFYFIDKNQEYGVRKILRF